MKTPPELFDPYVSRQSLTPEIIAREDPVVYPTEADGPLSAANLEQYARSGYLFLDRLLPDETYRQMLTEVHRLRQNLHDAPDPRVVRETDDQTLRSIFAIHHEPFFDHFVTEGILAAAARQILGSDVYVHQSRINFKSGFSGKDFYWHSDFETWHCEDGMPRMRALSCSIALTENLPTNGSLMVIPGSHQHFVACVGETPKDHYRQSLRQQQYGIPDRQSLTWLADQSGIDMPCGPAGSVLLFDCNLMHGSNSNITPYARSNVFLVFNSVENRLVDPYCHLPPRPSYIATRD